jgi:hypothetical protein
MLKSKCGSDQPSEPHLYVDSCSSLSPHGGGMTASARQRSGAPHLPKPVAVRDLAIATLQLLRWPAVLSLLRRAGRGRRPLCPGNQSHLRAFLGPPAIHPRESPASADSAAIIRQAQDISRFAEPTLRQNVASRNTKELCPCAEAVDDESSLWNTLEKPSETIRSIFPARLFNNLHTVKLFTNPRADSSQQPSSVICATNSHGRSSAPIRRAFLPTGTRSSYVSLTIRGHTVQLTLL